MSLTEIEEGGRALPPEELTKLAAFILEKLHAEIDGGKSMPLLILG